MAYGFVSNLFPASITPNIATYANGFYVVLNLGSATGYKSATGLTGSWSTFTLPSASSWDGLAWNGSVWLAVAGGEGVTATSSDLTTWIAGTTPFPTTANIGGLTAIGNTFYFTHGNSTGPVYDVYVYKSTNGTAWTAHALPGNTAWGGNGTFLGVVFNGTTYFTVATSIIGTHPTWVGATSPDGNTWTEVTVPTSTSVVLGLAVKGSTICFISEGYQGIAQAHTTTDGVVFTSSTFPANGVVYYFMTATQDYFVTADGIGSKVFAYSEDGNSWAIGELPVSHGWYANAANGANWLLTSFDGTAQYVVGTLLAHGTGWSTGETGPNPGETEDVVVLPATAGSTEDQVYYVVKRTINGAVVRYLEKWAKETECRGEFGDDPDLNRQADSFIVYSGSPATVISGLDHLEREEVIIWADGVDLSPGVGEDQTRYIVINGQITLNAPVENAIIGLPYVAKWESAKLGMNQSLAESLLNQAKRLTHMGAVAAWLHPKGFQFGPDFDHLNDLPEVERGQIINQDSVREQYDEPPIPFPGTWDADARLCIQAQAPRPVTLLALVPDMQIHT